MKKFDQYVRHLRILSRAFDEDLTNDFIVSGIIDKYYIQFELGWKVLKELLRYEGANHMRIMILLMRGSGLEC